MLWPRTVRANPRAVKAGRLAQIGVGEIPVHQVGEVGLDPLGAGVAVVDVVGVFPDIQGQDRLLTLGQRAFGVGGLDHLELASVQDQPRPAGAELGGRRGGEFGLEGIKAAEVLGDLRGDLAGRGAAALGLHRLPEEVVVVDLGGVVEHRTFGGLDQFDQGFAAVSLTVFDELIEVGDVGLVMLAVMIIEGLGGEMRREGILRIGQGHEGKGHGSSRGTEVGAELRPAAMGVQGHMVRIFRIGG